ncbi:hypothetical protein [Rubinisphaera italica]|uniref:Octanoyltransferase n=1 Tax=Rubinisphaera italica TaxID=2527969 RepID=A0A5C5XCB9_9PLAN|nr:hypothetical protein [Rubinisphaera italica]TWT59943.1 Octanoyltransferase [Rubinisphaera italica]
MTTILRAPRTLDCFLLRYLDLSSLLLMQKHFALEVRQQVIHSGVAVLTEHSACRSAGNSAEEFRETSSVSSELLAARRQAIAVNRPGGLWEHGPGQLGVFVTFSLEKTELSPLSFCRAVEVLVKEACMQVGIRNLTLEPGFGIHGRSGVVARTAFTVRDSIVQSVIYLNVSHNYRISSRPQNSSLSAEIMQKISIQSLKTAIVDQFSQWLTDSKISIFTTHPLLKKYRLSDLPNLDELD